MINLLTAENLMYIVQNPNEYRASIVAMAMELLEYDPWPVLADCHSCGSSLRAKEVLPVAKIYER
jgi:hypothetical protein